ncbi:J domain-containing protein [Hymenobacter pini]|uniref:J domain-containing protein n=1 Tax=Hymenobacter pini TaxID=2880879 RepID=UPI001CF36C8C|nr:J domain-containing protein [Hymenobacter pini]MCA8831993.1 DnaJ domain-containing protein [Hymenobacter pini]
MSYYEDLGIPEHTTPDDIRRAYRRLVLLTHPDRTPDPAAHQQFLRINEAYETLSEPVRRTAYDMRRKQHVAPVQASATPRTHRRAYAPRRPRSRYNLRPYVWPVQILGRLLIGLAVGVLLDYYVLRYTTTAQLLTVDWVHAPAYTQLCITDKGIFPSPDTIPAATTQLRLERSRLMRIVHKAWLPNGQALPVASPRLALVWFSGIVLVVALLTQWPRLSLVVRVYLLVAAMVAACIVGLMLHRVVAS